MNRHRSTLRCASTLSVAALLYCLLSATAAAEVPLRAFTASYDLHRSGMHFATAELVLAPDGEFWRWRLTTRARGIYTLFYDGKPYSEASFAYGADGLRLRRLELSDAETVAEDDYESADFDWQAREMQVLRKGTRRRAGLTAEVYDYQTIHLLAARMQLRGTQEETVRFYRKGKLVDSRLAYLGNSRVEFDGEAIDARVYEQTVERSSTVSRYYYDARNPLLPLRVESRKKDDDPTVLTLREVSWQS